LTASVVHNGFYDARLSASRPSTALVGRSAGWRGSDSRRGITPCAIQHASAWYACRCLPAARLTSWFRCCRPVSPEELHPRTSCGGRCLIGDTVRHHPCTRNAAALLVVVPWFALVVAAASFPRTFAAVAAGWRSRVCMLRCRLWYELAPGALSAAPRRPSCCWLAVFSAPVS